jgi:hypothetical protein
LMLLVAAPGRRGNTGGTDVVGAGEADVAALSSVAEGIIALAYPSFAFSDTHNFAGKEG